MEDSRFDALARALATKRNRRGFLSGVLGLGAGLAGTAAAGATCPPNQVDRRGVCVCATTRRPPVGGVCPCRDRATRCGDACVDTSSDEANCGACGIACAANERCRGGVCVGTQRCRIAGDCGVSNACATYACIGGACSQTTTVCDDGDLCTSSVCDPTIGCVHTPVVCANPTPICDSATGGCGPCLGAGDCPAGEQCFGGECVCEPLNGLACLGRECGTTINNCGDTVFCGPLGGECLECQVCDNGFCFGLSGGHDTCGQGGVCCGGICFQPCRTGTVCDPVGGNCGFNCASCCTEYALDEETGLFVCT